ncbi:NAD(P)/FAD-dependent oxidoreductase [Piscinibacter koreensis]|uniref:Tryptophan 7-halogenase n=1 Tax=Piscinibacter koreensis TaxID=2742824 RepID=A0A7Y6TVU1_9BURK|nr:NAD(P)/FAD-dependent oxidoreductase [Schlegelella koreensis]NUZ05464.1 tryptophan 7-halogenase [Schlegelella koreensis]
MQSRPTQTDLPPATAVKTCDVLVIGGGPAGSTIAALLAERGRDVVVMEKAQHPRFHIGESLLPANVTLFERLGVREQVEAIGMRKWGAEFVSPTHDHESAIEFAEAHDKSMPYAWQVRRSQLDELLFRNAAAKGARTLEGTRVRQVEFDDAGATVQVDAADGTRETWRVRYVVDASGRDTLLANQFRCKEKNPRHNSSALYAHFTGVERSLGKREGNIQIYWFEHGWFWFIPLADGVTSVGAVCWPHYLKTRKKPLTDFFMDTIALCPKLAARMRGATLVSEVHATGNYSYSSSRSSGERYVMLGDAYAFVDPVFSSGVLIAMQTAFEAVQVVETTLERPAEAAAARRRFNRLARHGPREFSWFIFRVTNPTMREFFMSPQNPFRVKEALISLLAGDIYGKTPIWLSIFVLKVLYYLVSIGNPRRTWDAWQRRRFNIRDVGAPAS